MASTEPDASLPGPHSMWVGIAEKVHDLLAPRIDARKTAVTSNMLEQFEQDMKPRLAPIIERVLADPNIPDEVRPLLQILAVPEHSLDSIAIGVAIGAILGPVLSAAITPLLQSLVNSTWGVAATLYPTGSVRPSPDLLAGSVLKAVLSESDAAAIAHNAGVGDPDFHIMVETAGQSIGLAEALLLFRRKQIPFDSADPTKPGLLQVLQYSNVNKRFYGLPELLQYVPLSVGEVVTANLKGHLPDADAVRMLQEAGIDGAAQATPTLNTQQLLRASAGRPPGIEQMLELWNKSAAGVIATPVGQADVENAVRQSDINDAYLPFVLEMRHYFPPPRSIVPMIRAGAISDEDAGKLLDAYGVGEPWKSAFIKEGHTTKASKHKELSESQIVASYEARLMDRPTALARLEALTYSAADANDLLDLADEKRALSLQAAAVRKIGAEYVRREITLPEATSALGAAQVPTAAMHDLLTYWDVEKSVNVHRPTPAQVVGAFRRGEIDALETKTRLIALGVQVGDLGIVVADGYPPSKAATARTEAAAVVNA